MDGRCDKHLSHVAEDRCTRCGNPFCADCLVYPSGPERPPTCLPCAVAAAGIRSVPRPPLTRNEAGLAARERASTLTRQRHRATRRTTTTHN